MKKCEDTAKMQRVIKGYQKACKRKAAIEDECKVRKDALIQEMGRVRAMLVGRNTVLVQDTVRVPDHTKTVKAYKYKQVFVTSLQGFAKIQAGRKRSKRPRRPETRGK